MNFFGKTDTQKAVREAMASMKERIKDELPRWSETFAQEAVERHARKIAEKTERTWMMPLLDKFPESQEKALLYAAFVAGGASPTVAMRAVMGLPDPPPVSDQPHSI